PRLASRFTQSRLRSYLEPRSQLSPCAERLAQEFFFETDPIPPAIQAPGKGSLRYKRVRLPSRHQLEQDWRLATACRMSSSAAASHCSTAYNPAVRRLGDKRFQAVRRQILQIPLSARRSSLAGSPSKGNSCHPCDPRP